MASPELNDFCRLCLRLYGSLTMTALKSFSENFGREYVTVADMLVLVCGLPAHHTDKFPQRICRQCVDRLEQAYRSFREFKEKEILLERFLLSGSIVQRLTVYQSFRVTENTEQEVSQQKVSPEPAEESLLKKPEASKVIEKTNSPQTDPSVSDADSPIVSTSTKKKKTRRKCQSQPKKTARYLKLHDGNFKCMVCDKKYTNEHSCRQHCYAHDALRLGLYKCSNCSTNFPKKSNLTSHELGGCMVKKRQHPHSKSAEIQSKSKGLIKRPVGRPRKRITMEPRETTSGDVSLNDVYNAVQSKSKCLTEIPVRRPRKRITMEPRKAALGNVSSNDVSSRSIITEELDIKFEYFE